MIDATSDISAAKSFRIAVASHNERLRDSLADILTEDGLEVSTIQKAHDFFSHVRDVNPQVLVVDFDMAPRDVLSAIRVLHKNPQTTTMAIVVLVSATTDKVDLRECSSFGAASILVKPVPPKRLLETVHTCYAQSQEIAAQQANVRETPSATHVPGNSSLLMRPLECQFHKSETPFSAYMLRAGKVGTEMSFFDVPVYTQAAKGEVYVNYHLLSVCVCPTCYFASSDQNYFLQPTNRRAEVHVMDPQVLQHVEADRAKRAAIGQALSEKSYTQQRTLSDALTCYELAIASSESLYAANPHTFAIELSRIGNYHLRIGLLQKEANAAGNTVDEAYQKALKVFQKAYVYLQGGTFYRNVYQIIALAIHFGDDASAYQYLARLKELGQEMHAAGEMPPEDKLTLARYLAQAEKAWEDRDYHRKAEG